MKHDLLHIQGKPYALVPLHEYRGMLGNQSTEINEDLPEDLLDKLYAGEESAIKIIRKYRNMTQADLAKNSGLSRPYLTEIETGNKDGSITAIKSIAKALDVNPGLLLL